MALYLGNTYIGSCNINERVVEKDVNFYDYEGTLLYSYTKQEALALTALPPLPDRTSENLTNEGWNMSIADIAERINKGMFYVAVGCTYHTTDNKTHMTVVPDENHTTIYLYIKPSIANDTTVYWGDGTSNTISSTSATQLSHTYSSNLFEIEVDLSIESVTGLHTFTTYIGGSLNNNTANKIVKINLSSKSRIAGGSIFSSSYYLEYITFHKDIIKDVSSSNFTYWLSSCVCLKHLNMPNIVAGHAILSYCTNIKRASIPILHCGYRSYRYCASLCKCESLFARGTSTTDYKYNNEEYVYNYFLESVYIDERVETFSDAFLYCYNLRQVIIPSTALNISASCFFNCFKLEKIYIKATTPPTLSDAFTAPNSFYTIYVPRASYNDYITASNWADIASHIQPYDY